MAPGRGTYESVWTVVIGFSALQKARAKILKWWQMRAFSNFVSEWWRCGARGRSNCFISNCVIKRSRPWLPRVALRNREL